MPKVKRKPSKATMDAVREAVDRNKELMSLIRRRNHCRRKAVQLLLSEGFSLREVGWHLGITGQRVGALVRYWELAR